MSQATMTTAPQHGNGVKPAPPQSREPSVVDNYTGSDLLFFCPACFMPVILKRYGRDNRLWLLNPDRTIGYGLELEAKSPTLITCANCRWSMEIHKRDTEARKIYKARRDAASYNTTWRGLPLEAINFPRPDDLPPESLLYPQPAIVRAYYRVEQTSNQRSDSSLNRPERQQITAGPPTNRQLNITSALVQHQRCGYPRHSVPSSE
jgi:hypothetical protein